jgi:radical SAM-linked protein
MQRLRVRFSREEEIKYISHLDIIRLWHRAFIRARIPLAHSEGFNPHPRISLAVPLSVGVTSEAELMDVFLTRPVSPHYFTDAVSQQLPPGVKMSMVSQVGMHLPSLQSVARFAEFKVVVPTEKSRNEVDAAIQSLLAVDSLPWQHQRDTGPRQYDLRALIDDLWLIDCCSVSATIGMRLLCGNTGSGRPEQVTMALGFESYPLSVHRTRIVLRAG